MKKLLFSALFLFAVQIVVGQEGVRYVRKDTSNTSQTGNKTIVNPQKAAVKDSTASKNAVKIQNPDKTSTKPQNK